MATISSGSVTITLAIGETCKFIATGEAYVDVVASSESYRLIGPSNERSLGNYSVPTSLTIRVISGSVDYVINPGSNKALNQSQISNGATGVLGLDEDGAPILGDGSKKIGNNIKRQNLGTRILSCRMGTFDNTTQKTFRNIIELAVKGTDAIRPIFANASASTYTISACNARVIANLTDALPTPTAVTLPSSGVVPVGKQTNLRPSYLVGDWCYLPTVPRTDGGRGALVVFDCYVSTSGSISVMGNGSSDVFTGWATRTNRKWIMRVNNGDCVTTPANFVSTTNISQSPLIGVQYLSRGRVITVMGVGDSITDGRGTIVGEGFGLPACELASTDEMTFEWANRGWAGQTPDVFNYYLQDFITDTGIIPDVVVYPNASPNGFTPPITNNQIQNTKGFIARITATASQYGIYTIPWTCLPSNPSVKDYNSSDSLRVALNAEWMTNYFSMGTLDLSTALSGITDGDGQVNMLAGSTTDNIHPNDVGNAILSTLLANELTAIKYF